MISHNRKALLDKILSNNPRFEIRDESEHPFCDECERCREEWIDWDEDFQICIYCFIEILKEDERLKP